jgi:hypothetical protein
MASAVSPPLSRPGVEPDVDDPGEPNPLRRALVPTLLLVVIVCSWHYGSRLEAGIDPSWQAALHMAAGRGLAFGRDLVFTYGPLGFLAAPTPWSFPTAMLALTFVAFVHVAFCITVYALLRAKGIGVLAAAVLTWVVAALIALEAPEMVLVLAAVWVLAALSGIVPTRFSAAVAPAVGGLAGALLLIKLNDGVFALLIVAAAAWFLSPGRWRSTVAAGGTAAALIAVGWVATRNPVGEFPTYVKHAAQVATGYTDAMWVETAARWELPVAVVLGALTLALVAWRVQRNRLPAVAVCLILLFGEFKHGFVRHDPYQALASFVVVAVIAIAVPWGPGPRRRVAPSALFVGALVTGLASVGLATINPLYDAKWAARTAGNLLVPWRYDDLVNQEHGKILAANHLPPAAVTALAHHTFHVEPYEASVAWAVGKTATWRPLPVFQTYSAYTPALDELNASALRNSRRAPSRILRVRRSITIDNRNPDFDSPDAVLAMLCNYRVELRQAAFDVLARHAGRCGQERPIASTTVHGQRPVTVPSPPNADDVVIARLHVDQSLGQRLRSALYRPSKLPVVTIDGHPYRLVVATAGGPLLLRAPPGNLPLPRFDQPVDDNTLVFSGIGDVRVDFFAISLRS